MHSFGGVGEKSKPIPTTFKASTQNDGFVSTTAGQKSRIIYRPTNAAQTSKIKFLNSDDGKGEDDGKHLNEGFVHKSKRFRNVHFKPNQGMPKIGSSQCLEESFNSKIKIGQDHQMKNGSTLEERP